MDYTSSAKDIEILIEVSEAAVDPRDLLVLAITKIKKIREELDDAYAEGTNARIEAKRSRDQVMDLEKFKSDVTRMYPEIELDLMKFKLSRP